MTRVRRGALAPFSLFTAEFEITDGREAYDYWQQHRAAWIAEYRARRGSDEMPDAFWVFEGPDELREADPDEPIDWRDYEHWPTWQTTYPPKTDAQIVATLERRARDTRLERRRRDWLLAHPEVMA